MQKPLLGLHTEKTKTDRPVIRCRLSGAGRCHSLYSGVTALSVSTWNREGLSWLWGIFLEEDLQYLRELKGPIGLVSGKQFQS